MDEKILYFVKEVKLTSNVEELNDYLKNDWYVLHFNDHSGVYHIGYAPEFKKTINP